jgi:hypothetical protein
MFCSKDAVHDRWRPRVYVSGPHGENRRAVPGLCSLTKPLWLDVDHLVWLAGTSFEAIEDDREMIFDLRTGKTKTFPISRHSQASTLYDVLNLMPSQFRGTTEPETFLKSLDRQTPGRFGISPDGTWVLTRHGRRKIFNFHDGEPRNMLPVGKPTAFGLPTGST